MVVEHLYTFKGGRWINGYSTESCPFEWSEKFDDEKSLLEYAARRGIAPRFIPKEEAYPDEAQVQGP